MRRCVLGLLVWVCACFADEGGAGGTTSADCPDGSNGCPCYGNGTCNEGLECSMGACILPGCQPGARDCNCVDGECLGELVCDEGACHDPSIVTEGSGMQTSATSTTDAADSTGGISTITATDGAESITTSPLTEGGVGDCGDQPECVACQECAVYGPCYPEYLACQQDELCEQLTACLETCPEGDDVCAADCAMMYMGGEVAFEPLAVCASCICAAPCMTMPGRC